MRWVESWLHLKWGVTVASLNIPVEANKINYLQLCQLSI